jgi:hypothetical protein
MWFLASVLGSLPLGGVVREWESVSHLKEILTPGVLFLRLCVGKDSHWGCGSSLPIRKVFPFGMFLKSESFSHLKGDAPLRWVHFTDATLQVSLSWNLYYSHFCAFWIDWRLELWLGSCLTSWGHHLGWFWCMLHGEWCECESECGWWIVNNEWWMVSCECYMVNGVYVNVWKLQPDVATWGYNLKLQLAIANCQPPRSRDRKRPWIAPRIVDCAIIM